MSRGGWMAIVLVLNGCAVQTMPTVPVQLAPSHFSVAQVGDTYQSAFVVCTECGAPTRKTLPPPPLVPVLPVAVPRVAPQPVPVVAAVTPLQQRREFSVHFRTASSRLDAVAEATLVDVLAAAKEASLSIQVNGYTDSSGAESFNDRLASRRAAAVATWLVRHGIPKSRVEANGDGRCCYVASNATHQGRQVNRRAVISLSIHERNHP